MIDGAIKGLGLRRSEVRAVVWLLALMALGSVIGMGLPHGRWFLEGGVTSKAEAWDAAIYESIAARGYAGAGASSVAFFPAWPLIVRGLIAVSNDLTLARALAIAVASTAGIASIVAFARMATRVLPGEGVAIATSLYALYPGAHCLFQPYPTALMQLLTILALGALLEGAVWRAATLSGIATAFGPLMVFPAMVIVLAGMRRRWIAGGGRLDGAVRVLLVACGLALLSFSGLILFMAWQRAMFGDALAFVAAGQSWEAPMTLLQRGWRALALTLAFPELVRAASRVATSIALAARHRWSDAQISFEDALDLVMMFVMIVGAAAASWLRERSLALAALLTIAGFIWFAGAPQGGQAAIRLLYPSVASFVGLGWLATRSRSFRHGLLILFALGLVVEQACLVAGYWVV